MPVPHRAAPAAAASSVPTDVSDETTDTEFENMTSGVDNDDEDWD